jgi:DNA-binding GntR family transcriptional regulator
LIVELLSNVGRGAMREHALEGLRSAIISGQYRPGDDLGEGELAQHLGVGRGTVRQALWHLQQEGLVTAGKRSMLRVKILSAQEVRELFRVRAALEGLAVRQLTASPDVAASVKKLREASGLADTDGDFAGRVETDLGFHLQLCRLSGNSVLVETWRFLENRIRVVIMSAGPERAQMLMTRSRYEPIIEAIESADPSVAVTVLNEHMAVEADHFARSPAELVEHRTARRPTSLVVSLRTADSRELESDRRGTRPASSAGEVLRQLQAADVHRLGDRRRTSVGGLLRPQSAREP